MSLLAALGCAETVMSPRPPERSPVGELPETASTSSIVLTGARADSMLWSTARRWASEGN